VVVDQRAWRGRQGGGGADWRRLVLASIVFVLVFVIALAGWLLVR
jgi:hypothetical protein